MPTSTDSHGHVSGCKNPEPNCGAGEHPHSLLGTSYCHAGSHSCGGGQHATSTDNDGHVSGCHSTTNPAHKCGGNQVPTSTDSHGHVSGCKNPEPNCGAGEHPHSLLGTSYCHADHTCEADELLYEHDKCWPKASPRCDTGEHPHSYTIEANDISYCHPDHKDSDCPKFFEVYDHDKCRPVGPKQGDVRDCGDAWYGRSMHQHYENGEWGDCHDADPEQGDWCFSNLEGFEDEYGFDQCFDLAHILFDSAPKHAAGIVCSAAGSELVGIFTGRAAAKKAAKEATKGGARAVQWFGNLTRLYRVSDKKVDEFAEAVGDITKGATTFGVSSYCDYVLFPEVEPEPVVCFAYDHSGDGCDGNIGVVYIEFLTPDNCTPSGSEHDHTLVNGRVICHADHSCPDGQHLWGHDYCHAGSHSCPDGKIPTSRTPHGHVSGCKPAPAPAAPAAASGLSLSAGDGRIAVSWTASATAPAAGFGYWVEWKLPTQTWDQAAAQFEDLDHGSDLATSYTITGLANGSAYDVRVAAFNDHGFSASITDQATPAKPAAPAAASGLSLAAGDKQIAVSWAASTTTPEAGFGYRVQWKLVTQTWDQAAGQTEDLDHGSDLATSHTITGLANGSAYDVRVAAFNADGVSDWITDKATPTAPAYKAPASLVATVRGYAAETHHGQDHVDRWNGALEGLCVEDFPGVSAMTSAQAQGHADAYSSSRWSPVVAELKKAEAANCTIAPKPEPKASAPDPASGLSLSAGDKQIAVSWTASATTPAAGFGYRVQWKLTTQAWGDAAVQSTDLDHGVDLATSHMITGLVNGSAYDVRVAAFNANGLSAWISDQATPAAPASAPDPPSGLSVAAGDKQIAVSWSASATTPVDGFGYRVRWKLATQTWDDVRDWDHMEDLQHGVDLATSWTITGLANGSAHDVRVAAYNTVGFSVWVTAQATPAAAAPDPASGLSVAAGDKQIAVSWSASATAPADGFGYRVQWKLVTQTWDQAAAAAQTEDLDHGSDLATSHTITGLANGSAYDVRVAAFNADGASDWITGQTTPTTPKPKTKTNAAPAKPANVAASCETSGTDTVLTITWSAPADSPAEITGYGWLAFPNTALNSKRGTVKASQGDQNGNYTVTAQAEPGKRYSVAVYSASANNRSNYTLSIRAQCPS